VTAPGANGRRPVIWLLQDGEPLPLDDSPRLMRTGDQANFLSGAGWDVIWWSSRFNHNLKRVRRQPAGAHRVSDGLTIVLLEGPAYRRNLSAARIRHYRALARQFERQGPSFSRPDLILGSYPSPELCAAGARYARTHHVPFVIDIRDPWPDIFQDYVPSVLSWTLTPVVAHYQNMMRTITAHAQSVVAVSNAMLDWGLGYADRAASDHDVVIPIGYRAQTSGRTIDVPPTFSKANPLVCLFATTCGRSYDGDALIDAARILETSGEDRFKIVVIGDGEMRPAWLARAAGVRSVHFTGWMPSEQLQEQLRASHLGMVLLKPGGIARFWMGNKIFEYLASYLGLVNSVPGEASDLVRQTGVGVNVKAGDASSVATALRALIDAPQDVARHMAAARTVFHREFERDSIQRRYAEHLGSVLAKYRQQRPSPTLKCR
jgi:glycosyltransferase involved in cell wall biosynthesis